MSKGRKKEGSSESIGAQPAIKLTKEQSSSDEVLVEKPPRLIFPKSYESVDLEEAPKESPEPNSEEVALGIESSQTIEKTGNSISIQQTSKSNSVTSFASLFEEIAENLFNNSLH